MTHKPIGRWVVVLAIAVVVVVVSLALVIPRLLLWPATTIDSWEPGSDATIVVTVMGDGDPAHLRVKVVNETSAAVRLHASVGPRSQAGNAMGYPMQVKVTLKAALGDRQVVDDRTGATVPRRAS